MSSSTNDNNLAVDFWMESNGSKRKRFATRSTEKVTGVCSELTVQRLAKLRTFIEKKSEAMNLSELINVNSNIQTIENLCDLAMLIKVGCVHLILFSEFHFQTFCFSIQDKEANIDCDSEGNVLVSKREEDASNCNETNKQMVC